MINDKVSSEKIILAIVILVALGLVAYFVMLKNSPPVVIQPTPSPVATSSVTSTPEPTVMPTPTPSIDISDWKTYRNDKYGFEFKYPKEYSEQLTAIDSGKNVLSLSSELATFEIIGLMISDNKNYDFSSIDSFKEWHSKSKYMTGNDLQDVEKTIFNQLNGLKTHEADGINSIGDYIYFQNGELIVYFVNDYNDHNYYKNNILASMIFNQIISTFKFIK